MQRGTTNVPKKNIGSENLVSDVFLFPFVGLVGTPSSGGMVLEFSSIIAMLVYALLAWGLERIIWVSFYRPRGALVGVTQTTISEPDTVTKTTTREQYNE